MEVPSTEWRARPWTEPEAQANAPAPAPAHWLRLPGCVGHTFTHFHLELMVLTGRAPEGAACDGIWVPPDRLGEHALPTLMKKIAAHALGNGSPAAGGRRYSS